MITHLFRAVLSVTLAFSSAMHAAAVGRHGDQPRAPLGWDLSEGWFDAAVHSDFSPQGTPYSDLLLVEVPFMCRMLKLDTTIVREDGGNILETVAALELALSRRMMLTVEAPYLFLDPDKGGRGDGFADFSASGRFMLVETDRFVLSLNVEAGFPTGRRGLGLSAEEVVIEPSLLAWCDLGAGFALYTQAGYERGVESDHTEIFYRGALAWSVHTRRSDAETPPNHKGHAEARQDDHPSRAGLLTLAAEFSGRTALESREEEETTTSEILFGAIYSLADNFDLRAGYLFAVGQPQELRDGMLCGVIWHF